jgi:hypothetical protein
MATSSKSTWTIVGLNCYPLSKLVENDKYKQLYDMVQKSSSREISSEQYTRTLGFKYQTRTEV